ncbi:ester cyclase [Ahrensia kielensis]|uniref:Ester cyclase n=1 Tax=Ahrensia kielensis TaxID=76980 RepID=A0ABU9TA60_9HYPH
MALKGFSKRWKNFPDYILGCTKDIWEDRGIATLDHYYAKDIIVRSPMGIQRGNEAVKASTMATCHEFPDRELLGEDVIWSEHETGLLSSHRITTIATHTQDGAFGKATGKKFKVKVIADCAAKNDAIFDEWLVRDYGGIVRQLGMKPKKYAKALIKAEGGVSNCSKPFTPDQDIDGGYQGTGNDNEWGEKYADILTKIMAADFNVIKREYDRALVAEYAGGRNALSYDGAEQFWIGLRSAFPNAIFKIHHQIGMDADMLCPRSSIRWTLDGKHEGWGNFGRPTGAQVHVMGMCHAEFGPWGLRREIALYDEVAIWKQILIGAEN